MHKSCLIHRYKAPHQFSSPLKFSSCSNAENKTIPELSSHKFLHVFILEPKLCHISAFSTYINYSSIILGCSAFQLSYNFLMSFCRHGVMFSNVIKHKTRWSAQSFLRPAILVQDKGSVQELFAKNSLHTATNYTQMKTGKKFCIPHSCLTQGSDVSLFAFRSQKGYGQEGKAFDRLCLLYHAEAITHTTLASPKHFPKVG